MGQQHETWVIGEVHCLNCGCVLAEVVRGEAEDTLNLRPARFQSAVQVVIAGRRLLRCQRCQGRALVELFDDPYEERQAEVRGKRYAVA
jgi:hypothetical protein